MGEDTREIRQEIEHTRTQMGDTVEALGYKTDVSGRAKRRTSRFMNRVSGATPDTDDVKTGARKATGVAEQNPLGLAVAAAGVGFIAGMMLPSTDVEDRKIGPLADEAKDKAMQTGKEALERGKDVAEQAAQSAMETAKETGQEQAEAMRESTQGQSTMAGDSTTSRPGQSVS